VKNAKTLPWVEKRKNGEDGCMMMRGTNAIDEKNLKGPRKKKNHTFG